MGLFQKKNKTEEPVILPEGAKCCRCGKKLKQNDSFTVLDRKLYCQKCAQAKRDWDFLEWHALIDD